MIKRGRTLFGWLLLACALHSQGEVAPTAHQVIDVGGVAINTPPPFGFFELKARNPRLDPYWESFLVPGNLLLAIYGDGPAAFSVDQNSPPPMKRYMMLQTTEAMEAQLTSREDFNAGQEVMAAQYEAMMKKVEAMMGEFEGEAEKGLSAAWLTEADIDFGEQIPLGIHHRGDYLAMSSIASYTVSVEEETEEIFMVNSAAMFLVKGKLLFAYTYSNYRDERDVEWTRQQNSQWVEAITAANRPVSDAE